MTENHAIEGAISILANTMRLYVETPVRFAEGLLNVDLSNPTFTVWRIGR
jgi:hypothetical protein